MSPEGFDSQFASTAGKVNTSAPSTTGWRGVRNLIAEQLGIGLEDVYVATISKPGNVSVRFLQSRAANAATVLVAMHTDAEDTIDQTIDAVRKVAAPRNATAIVAMRESGRWSIVAVVERRDQKHAVGFLDNFPNSVILPPSSE